MTGEFNFLIPTVV